MKTTALIMAGGPGRALLAQEPQKPAETVSVPDG